MTESCETTIEQFCARVGLERRELQAMPNLDVPRGTVIWASSYARLLLWPLTDKDSLTASAKGGQGYLDAVLNHDEGKAGPTLDGYLILRLPEPPVEAMEADLANIENSTQVCRKFVTWPDKSPLGWRGLMNVGVLSLPSVGQAGAGAPWPDFDAVGSELCERVLGEGWRKAADDDFADTIS